MRHRKAGRQLRRTSEQKLALMRGLAPPTPTPLLIADIVQCRSLRSGPPLGGHSRR